MDDRSAAGSTSRQRPLSGVNVVDFGHYVAGPAVAMMLADLGAEVIHVDPSGGPTWESPAAQMLNRGKTCVQLDLKDPSDLEKAKKLCLKADVLIENFRPRVMQRLGLGYEDLTSLNPGLIYLSLPGFSSKDPERSHIQAFEGIVAATTGQYSDMGLNRVLMGIEPSFSPLTLASAYGASLGAGAVTLALSSRQKTGQGDHIEVPLASALMEGLVYNAFNVENYPDRYKSPREIEIERRVKAGEPMDLSYDQLQEFLDPFYRNYECADGRLLYIVCGSHNQHPIKLLKVLNLWDKLLAEGLPQHSAYLDTADWPEGADCTISNYPLSPKWAARVSSLMKDKLKQKPAKEWETICGEAKIPVAMQRTTQDWLHDPHPNECGLILDVKDPGFGNMKQLGCVSWLSSDAEYALNPKPRSMVDANDIDFQSIKPESKIEKNTVNSFQWLDGLKVLDLTNVIAGPTIASTLARFGAEVISIDHVNPTMDPWNAIVFGLQAGRGKRSILMDLKSEDGQTSFAKLLKWADIVTINATDNQLPSLGLTPEELMQTYPELIICQLDCFGGPSRGQRSDHPGYDDLAQASTGIMIRFGGSEQTPEEHAHFGTIDVLGGFCAIIAIGAALYHKGITGKGDIARSSLCAAGQLIQAPFMYDFSNREPFDEPSGRQIKGMSPLYRAYEAEDGWFFLTIADKDRDSFEKIEELTSIALLNGPELEEELGQIFKQKPKNYWVKKIQEIGLGAIELRKMHQVRETDLVLESAANIDLANNTYQFIRHDQHPSGRYIDICAPNAIRSKNAKVRVPTAMPKPGTHTIEILQEIGLSDAEIDVMLNNGSIATSWSEKYLPE